MLAREWLLGQGRTLAFTRGKADLRNRQMGSGRCLAEESVSSASSGGRQAWEATERGRRTPERVALVALLGRVGEAAVTNADVHADLVGRRRRRELPEQRLRQPLRAGQARFTSKHDIEDSEGTQQRYLVQQGLVARPSACSISVTLTMDLS